MYFHGWFTFFLISLRAKCLYESTCPLRNWLIDKRVERERETLRVIDIFNVYFLLSVWYVASCAESSENIYYHHGKSHLLSDDAFLFSSLYSLYLYVIYTLHSNENKLWVRAHTKHHTLVACVYAKGP